jgi:hypothetical protein
MLIFNTMLYLYGMRGDPGSNLFQGLVAVHALNSLFETFAVPSPLAAAPKSRSHANEQRNISRLAILFLGKDESERPVSPQKTRRSKLAVAERTISIAAVAIANVGPRAARAAGFICERDSTPSLGVTIK